MKPFSTLALLVATTAGAPAFAQSAPGGAPGLLRRQITVPIDRTQPSRGSATLTIDLGAPFDPRKPTVIVVEDGQQFYVRPGAMAALQHDLFGTEVNVAGLVPRGSDSVFTAATVDAQGTIDWLEAWRVFNSAEWIADIEAARQALVGREGAIDLYGRSGGAYLVHQYLAVHGAHVRRAFTQSAVDPALNRELGIPLDAYLAELARSDSSLWRMLQQSLPASGDARLRALLALQRQHFYVPADSFAAAQRALIMAFARSDSLAVSRLEKQYEVDDIMQLERSRAAIPQDVRVLELLQPSGAFQDLGPGTIYPLLESQATFIRPLLDLVDRGTIAVVPRDGRVAHQVRSEVFVLAAKGDEAVDYRTSIALAAGYPTHVLFIADDNHVFQRMDQLGLRRRLVEAFFGPGKDSPTFTAALTAAEAVRWHANP